MEIEIVRYVLILEEWSGEVQKIDAYGSSPAAPFPSRAAAQAFADELLKANAVRSAAVVFEAA